MDGLVLKLPNMVTSSVYNTRTKTDVLGMNGLVLELPIMVVTLSVYNTRTKTGVLGTKRLVLKLPKMVNSSV